MTLSAFDLKHTSRIALQKSLAFVTFSWQQLYKLLAYGVVFLSLIVLSITAHTLFNDQHLHIDVTVDGQEYMLLDLRRNPH